jgi:hypothetical protein
MQSLFFMQTIYLLKAFPTQYRECVCQNLFLRIFHAVFPPRSHLPRCPRGLNMV